MDIKKLNPTIHAVSLYEKINRSEECIAYDCKLVYMISGDITATVGEEKIGHLSPGHLLYIPAGVRYRLKGKYLRAVVISFDMTDMHPELEERLLPVLPADYKPELCRNSDLLEPFRKAIHLPDLESERDTFIRMSNIFTSAEGTYLAELSAMLKLELLKVAETADEHALPARMVEALDNYIRENCSDEISNTEIGAIFGYHPFYVSTVIKEKRGVTLHQYVVAYRLRLAKNLLECTDKTVAEIAEETGFTDASYFTKSFKAAFGKTPKEWRNEANEDLI